MRYAILEHEVSFERATKQPLARRFGAAGVAAALILTTASTMAQTRDLTSAPWDRTAGFITSLPPRLTVANRDPRRHAACANVERGQCPQMLIWGGTAKGGLPTLDPAFSAKTPHVRVSFVLQRFQIQGPAEGNVEPEGSLTYEDMIDTAWWETHSSAASLEIANTWIDFDDGTDPIDGDGYVKTPLVIYDALVLNSCAGFSSFPVSHTADFAPPGGSTTAFQGYDDTTIDSTGFYNFSYTIPVFDEGPELGALRMSGKVNVTCTAQKTLPMP